MPAYQYIYVMKGLTKIFPGGRKVLEDIWLSFYPGAKIGVLGLNGSGKSTLLRIMAGIEKDVAGEAWAAEGVTVGYLPAGAGARSQEERAGERPGRHGRDQGPAGSFRSGQRQARRGNLR